MPIYEYECGACGHRLEALQKITESPLKKCPDCGKPRLRRLLSAPMFLLKGSGWYETDFKTDKEQKRNLADRPDKEEKAGVKTENKAEPAAAKTDSKPEPKAEAAPADRTRARRTATRKAPPRRAPRKPK